MSENETTKLYKNVPGTLESTGRSNHYKFVFNKSKKVVDDHDVEVDGPITGLEIGDKVIADVVLIADLSGRPRRKYAMNVRKA